MSEIVGSFISPFVRECVASIAIPAVVVVVVVFVIVDVDVVIILWNGGGMAVQWLILHSSAL